MLWDSVSAFIHLPRMFLSMPFFIEKQIAQVIMDRHYIKVTWGLSAGVFQAWQLILLVVFGAMDEPLASRMMAHF